MNLTLRALKQWINSKLLHWDTTRLTNRDLRDPSTHETEVLKVVIPCVRYNPDTGEIENWGTWGEDQNLLGDLTVVGDLEVQSDIDIWGDLDVGVNAIFNDNVLIQAQLHFGASLAVNDTYITENAGTPNQIDIISGGVSMVEIDGDGPLTTFGSAVNITPAGDVVPLTIDGANLGAGTHILHMLRGTAGTNRFVLENVPTSMQAFLEAGASIGLFGTISNHGFSIRTNYTNRMFFDTAGNVGIGLTSMSQTLDVNGDIRTRANYYSADNSQGHTGWFDDGVNFRVTVKNGIITAIGNSVAGGWA